MWFIYLPHTVAGTQTGCNSATYTERKIDRASAIKREVHAGISASEPQSKLVRGRLFDLWRMAWFVNG